MCSCKPCMLEEVRQTSLANLKGKTTKLTKLAPS